MLPRIFLLALVICLVSPISTNLYEGRPEIEFLNRDNFDKTQQGNWLVQFYAHWCEHSKDFVPQYLQIAKRLEGVLNIGAINAAIHKTSIRIRTVPQFKLFINGIVINYRGARNVDDIVNFVHKNLNAEK